MNIEQTTTPVDTVNLATGIRVSYTTHGDPSGEPVVFLHGWPDSNFSFSRVMPLLAPTRIRSYAYDQRGFGDADRPITSYAIDQFAADAVAFLDAVGLERATLVGHSFGSFVARRAAEQYPRRVTRLVLIGSAMSAANAVLLEVLDAVRDLKDPIALEFVREFQASTLHIPVPEAFFDGLVAESAKAPARVWHAALANLLELDDVAALETIAAPTLIVWGDHDGLFASRDDQERLAATVPDSRLTVYPDTGHSPNWERPQRLARDIEAFMGLE